MSLVKPVNTISNRMFSLARSANNTKFSITERYPPPPTKGWGGGRVVTYDISGEETYDISDVWGWRRMTFQTTPTWNRNKFLFTGFFRALERKIDVDMADFTLGRKQWEILRHTSDNLNWFVGLALGTKFPPPPLPRKKIVLFLACHGTVGCSWSVKWNLRSRLKKSAI